MDNDRYIKLSQKSRETTGFTDDKIRQCIDGMKTIIDALENVLEGNNTIAGALRDRKLNLLKTRDVMYGIGKIYEDEREGYGRGEYQELLTPLEDLYCDIFGLDKRTTEVAEVMPPDAAETMAHIFENYEEYGLREREVRLVSRYYLDEKTLEELGKEEGVTRYRVRQIIAKAIRKLRHPIRGMVLKNGIAWQNRFKDEYAMRKEEEMEKLIEEKLIKDDELNKIRREIKEISAEGKALDADISELELSVRSYNCLKRAGLFTIRDVMSLEKMSQFANIKNLGKKSTDEIISAIKRLYPDWKVEFDL